MGDERAAIPSRPDICVIGGGAAGLWCAIAAAEQGLVTVVTDAGRLGQGASGGILGALMPHQPVNMDDKKAFQLEALLSLETRIRELEEATGLDTGYWRCGRLQPLRDAGRRDQARLHAIEAAENWPKTTPGGAAVTFGVIDRLDLPAAITPAPEGAIFDTLSARVEPRSLVKALAARARQLGVAIAENCRVTAIEADGTVVLDNAQHLHPGHTIVAAGTGSFALAEPLASAMLGSGVKGQAALLQPVRPMPRDMPILFDAGTYVIAHDTGLAAVGSTSEMVYDAPRTTDGQLDAVIEAAYALCPLLAGAQVVERWAQVRPRPAGRDPVVGPLPGMPRVILCTGGYKITLGIAHRMADAALGFVTGEGPVLPPSFGVAHHLEAATRRQ